MCLHVYLVGDNLKVVRSVFGVSVAACTNEKEERLIALHPNGRGFYYKTNRLKLIKPNGCLANSGLLEVVFHW